MALDPSIILGNRGVDVVGAMGAGNALAAQTNQLQQQNALAQLYKTQGAGIMNGDPSALNALAAIDPAAGQGFQAGALGMDQTRQQMAILDENTKRAAEEYARGLSAEQKAAEAAQIEAGVKQALMAPTPEAFDAMMIQMGHPDMVGQFENREALAAQFMSVAEIMKTITPPATDPLKGAPEGYMFLDPNNPAAGVVPIPGMPVSGPEWRAATPEEAAAYGAAAGQFNTKTGEFKKSSADNGITQTIRNPDGTETTIQIGGSGAGGGKPFTEGQSKDVVFATKAKGALAVLDPIADSLASVGNKALDYDPTGLIRGAFQSDNYQMARQSGLEFLAAILRKETGAAVTPSEEAWYGEMYLPRPGDGAPVLAQKKKARARAVAALEAGMNAEQIAAQEKALATEDGTPPASGNVTSSGVQWSVAE